MANAFDPTFEQSGKETDDEYEKSTPELNLEELLLRFKAWWREDQPHCKQWHIEAKKNFKFRAGDQWADADKSLMQDVQKRACLTFNMIDPTIDAVAGSEITNRQEVRYIPRQVGNAAVNEVLTEAGRWFRDQCDAEHEESAAFTDAATAGMGWTETRLDYEDNPDGDPRIERLDTMEMFWDHAAKQANLIDARRLWRVRREVPLIDVKNKWPTTPDGKPIEDDSTYDAAWATEDDDTEESPYVVHTAGEPLEHESDEGRQDRTVTQVQIEWVEKQDYYRAMMIDPTSGQPQKADLTEEQHFQAQQRADMIGAPYKGIKQTRKVYYRAFVGSEILEVTKMTGPSGEHAKSFSIVPITGKWDRDKAQFYGLVRSMEGPQTYANKWLSTSVEIMARAAKGGLMLEEGAVQDVEDFETDWAKPGANAYFKPGAITGGKVQPKPASQFPNDFMQMTAFAIQSIRQVTGVNAESIGAQDQDQAASLEYQRRQSATTILAPLFDSLRRYRRIQGRYLLFLITEYLTDGRLIRIVGQDGEQYVPLIRDPSVTEFDVIVDDAPSSPSQKELVWNSMVTMMPMIQNMQPPPGVILALLDYSPLPASVVAKIKSAVQDAQQNAQPQPSPADLIMMQKQADVQGDQQLKQQNLQFKEQDHSLDIAHERALAQIKLEAIAAQEHAKMLSKQHDGSNDLELERAKLINEARQLEIEEFKAQTERMVAMKPPAAEPQTTPVPAPDESAPAPPDHTPAILELIKHLGSQKRPTGIKRVNGGMHVTYEGE